jgi:hypothetical protein
MWHEGLSCLTGCDPYLEEELETDGVRLIKADAAELVDSFDVVMTHHSFEHMADPHGSMETLRRLLRRRLVIRVPVLGFAWREYGVDWLGLDAPRHLHITSREGMRRLVEAHGLRVVHDYCDSGTDQFWASEQYAADIPLRDPRSFYDNPAALTAARLSAYEQRARELNAAGDGDSAVFLVEPA